MAFNNEDILILAKAGFSAQQIAALNMATTTPAQAAPAQAAPTAPAQAAPTAPAQATPAQAAPAQAAPAQAAPAQTAPAPTQGATVDDVLKSVKDLTATFQNGFMLNTQQPKPVTAEDILANIINPPSPNKEV